MPEQTSQITIISDLLKRDPAYKEVVDQIEERLYNRYIVYLSDKPKFNAKTQAIPKQYLSLILSFKNTLGLNKAAKKYNLTQEQRDILPEILWKIFHKEAEIKNLPQMLNSELNINNIRDAYLIAIDIANIYLPISDYLGDIPMVIKRWRYEMPTASEPTISQIIQPKISAEQPIQKPQEIIPAPIIQIPPITPPPIQQSETIQPTSLAQPQIDEPIQKVQETLARLSQKLPKEIPPVVKPVQPTPQPSYQEPPQKIPPPTGKSDFEPEYLPDEPQKPINKGNIIDLKNF